MVDITGYQSREAVCCLLKCLAFEGPSCCGDNFSALFRVSLPTSVYTEDAPYCLPRFHLLCITKPGQAGRDLDQ